MSSRVTLTHYRACSILEKKERTLLFLAGSVSITHSSSEMVLLWKSLKKVLGMSKRKTKQPHRQTSGRADFSALSQRFTQTDHLPAFQEVKEKHSPIVFMAEVIPLV